MVGGVLVHELDSRFFFGARKKNLGSLQAHAAVRQGRRKVAGEAILERSGYSEPKEQ
jgi:hypothetical protein